MRRLRLSSDRRPLEPNALHRFRKFQLPPFACKRPRVFVVSHLPVAFGSPFRLLPFPLADTCRRIKKIFLHFDCPFISLITCIKYYTKNRVEFRAIILPRCDGSQGSGMQSGTVQHGFAAICLAINLPASAASPEHLAATVSAEARVEFAKAGSAIRERLEREAAGDTTGARIAADDAEAHRSRYRQLTHEVNHGRPTAPTFSSVAAPRDPFVPDAISWRAAEAGPIRLTTTGSRTQSASAAVVHAPWDLYSRHGEPDRPESAGTAHGTDADERASEERGVRRGDLYTTHRSAGGLGAGMRDSLVNNSSKERSNEPFLVYRERLTADEAHP
jgi:hypothetical protein